LQDLTLTEPKRIRLSLLADDNEILKRMAVAYCEAAVAMPANVVLWQLLPSGAKRVTIADADWSPEKLTWEQTRQPAEPLKSETWQLRLKSQPGAVAPTSLLFRQRVPDWQKFLCGDLTGVVGLLMEIDGPRVFQRFVGESGLHRFVLAQSKPQCVVETALPKLSQFLPPVNIGRKGALPHSSKCRDYDNVKNVVIDTAAPKPQWFALDRLSNTIAQLMKDRHTRAAEALIV